MEIIGYIASVLIGISLGLIGGGGSILTVPVLVYLFNIDAVLATYYSLFVVGCTSIVGSLAYLKNGLLSLKTAVFFGIPSVIFVYLSRTFVLPAIPDTIFSLGSFVFTKNILLMVLFAVLMIFASFSMIKKTSVNTQPTQTFNYPKVFSKGAFVGFITGLIGAGGGFLIIPSLVNFLNLPMKKAIGTSLLIISINSILGFSISFAKTTINWQLLLTITLIAIIGIIIGSYLSTKIDGKKLKPAFGWFVLIMGVYIILKEIIR